MPRKVCMRYFLTAVGILVTDQLVKLGIRASFSVGDSIPVLGDFFRIAYIRNDGAAWGIFSGMRGFLMFFPLIVMIAIVIFLWKNPRLHWMGKLSLTMIAAGGLGNLIDRILFGYVTDMFSFSIFSPVFNVADISVTCGCGLLILFVLLGDRLGNGPSESSERS